uniref:arsenate reductase/protein-tyrosine-phosphatase family protein n=1 Tax=Nonomuraea pusilla TaxID=46177 RepID=UPI0006E44DBB|nr:low molecular weight phosphatase family protein [Nonomuraea pusilla]
MVSTSWERFHILFVCTGNICRSPIAERLARAALGPPFVVTSAGTQARPGLEMARGAQDVLRRLGLDADGFVSKPLTPELLAEADLVLTAAREHRAEAVSRLPRVAPRVFTITEFDALTGMVQRDLLAGHRDAVPRARALVEQAVGLRGLVRVDQPDIADPIGRSGRAYRAAGRAIHGALTVPLALLRSSPLS